MIYVIQIVDDDFVLIGTSGWVRAMRGLDAVGQGLGGRVRKVEARWMLDGDEDGAAVRAAFTPAGLTWGPLAAHWLPLTPALRSWLDENARRWDGSDAELLGLKGPARRSKPKAAPRAVARVGNLGDRLRAKRGKAGA